MLGSAAGEVEAEAADGEAFPVAAEVPGAGTVGLRNPRTPAAVVHGDRTEEARRMAGTTRNSWVQGEGKLPIRSHCRSTLQAPARVPSPDPAATLARYVAAQTVGGQDGAGSLQKKSSYSSLV